MAVKPIPDGYHSITPYLVVQGAGKLIEFLKQAFGAEETMPPMKIPDGTVAHAELRIGDSLLMLGEAGGEHKPMPATLYLYVRDSDAVFRQAIQAGATSLREPADMFYGDRTGNVMDPCGNVWGISTHREDVPYEELMRRAAAAHQS